RNHLRQRHLHFYKLMSLRTRISQRRRTTIAQTKLLTRLRSRRNAQLSFSVNSRHFDLRAERRLRHRDRNRDVDVVALAREILVLTNVRDDVQITCGRTETSALAFSGNLHARASINPGGNADFHRLRLIRRALAVTEGTWCSSSSRPTTIRALLRKTQPAARSLHLPRTFARRTNNNRPANVASAIAARTLLRPVDSNIGRESFDRFFERETQRHLDVSAALRLRTWRFFLFRSTATEEIGEDIAKTGATASRRRGGAAPVKTSEIKTRRSTTAARWTSTSRMRVGEIFRVLPKTIVDASLLRIGQHVVRFRHQFEAFL